MIGEVKKPGGFTLGDRKEVTVLEALSFAEGPTSNASPRRARILRPIPGSVERAEVNIDLRKLMQGKIKDQELDANDILIVPDNSTRRAAGNAAQVALQTISGIIIWHVF